MTSHSPDSVETATASEAATEAAPKEQIGYTLWAVLRRNPDRVFDIDGSDVEGVVGELDAAIASVEAEGVVVRGLYDVSGLRADADLMIWLHGETPETIQWALRQLRRTAIFKDLLPTWNAMGVHRAAEFSADHMPSFMKGKAPAGWLTVYPFVRSYEWYLLPDEERRGMLAEHGRAGSKFRTTLPNTVASFALGDYEWILALEDDVLTNLVDMMRDLRSTDARRHVREEVPFYTGRRIETAEVVEVLQ